MGASLSWRVYEETGSDHFFPSAWSDYRARPVQAVCEMGRADCGGFPDRNSAIERNLSAPVRDSGEAWAAFAAGNRFAERSLRRFARRRAGICRGFSGILLRADL